MITVSSAGGEAAEWRLNRLSARLRYSASVMSSTELQPRGEGRRGLVLSCFQREKGKGVRGNDSAIGHFRPRIHALPFFAFSEKVT